MATTAANSRANRRDPAGGLSPAPVQRATQFHELLERGPSSRGRLPTGRRPLAWQVQPMPPRRFAQRQSSRCSARNQAAEPVDLGGPEVLTAKARRGSLASPARRPAHRSPNVHPPGRTARAFRRGLNTTPEHADGVQTWEQFAAIAHSRRDEMDAQVRGRKPRCPSGQSEAGPQPAALTTASPLEQTRREVNVAANPRVCFCRRWGALDLTVGSSRPDADTTGRTDG